MSTNGNCTVQEESDTHRMLLRELLEGWVSSKLAHQIKLAHNAVTVRKTLFSCKFEWLRRNAIHWMMNLLETEKFAPLK